MNATDQKIISYTHAAREGATSVFSWLLDLKAQGLCPAYIAMDGERSVMSTMRTIWPETKIQRCLYHIQREGMRWLRTYPKTDAGRALRRLLQTLCGIHSFKERDRFIQRYNTWSHNYKDFVASLPKTNIAFKDLKKTVVLINNALPDMFHYLNQPSIPRTTNTLESYYSRLKSDYRRHRGLTKENRINYLNWYCYFKNSEIPTHCE